MSANTRMLVQAGEEAAGYKRGMISPLLFLGFGYQSVVGAS
jgi:hypothetical protein